MNLYIGNIDFRVKEQELRQLFETIGDVKSVKIITDRETGRSKGFAFVEMPKDEDGDAAIAELAGATLGQRQITVTQARPRPEAGNRR